MQRTILLYNFSGKRLQAVRKALLPLNCLIKCVSAKEYSRPLGVLLGVEGNYYLSNITKPSESFTDEMLVMHGFGSEMIDVLIAALQKGGIGKIPLKAVVTPHNIMWSSIELYKEIKAEHELMG